MTAESAIFSSLDHRHMAEALRLARQGLTTTRPNPRVGCVITRNEQVVGTGWHQQAGMPHAEPLALAVAGSAANGATAYITLEPCMHQGRTPPCAPQLIHHGIRRVVVAMQDPDPRVQGRGIEELRHHGILVECGLMEAQARELNVGFIKRMMHGVPWIRAKIAASLDGGTALSNGQSQWITAPSARRDVHRWRARSCALLTGINTVLADDPQLSLHEEVTSGPPPLKVVLDSQLRLPPTSRLITSPGHLLVAHVIGGIENARKLESVGAELWRSPNDHGRVNLDALFKELAKRQVNEVWVEAGETINGGLISAERIDELLLYFAPRLLGSGAKGLAKGWSLPSLDRTPWLRLHDQRFIGHDLRVIHRWARKEQTG